MNPPAPPRLPLTPASAIRALAAVITVALAASCGGGSDAPSTTPLATAPATAPIVVVSFGPASGGTGTVVTVTGSGFTGVTNARVGGVATTFSVASDAQLQLTVPAGAQSGRIELAGDGRSVVSATDFTVVFIPQVASVTPTSVLTGARVTLAGSSLDRAREVRLNGMQLPIVTQTATTLVIDVVAGATSGVLTVVDADGGARAVAQSLTVLAPMTLTSFAPTAIVTGNALTVNGTGLDRAVGITFANGATANVATRSGTTRLTATVPDSAGSGPIRVRGSAADEVVAATPLTVIPAIRVDANAIYPVAAAGASVTVAGTGLTEVSAVMVGAATAAIVSKSATQLVFSVPAGVACGAITLQSASQPSVAGGSVVVGGGCVAALAGVQFAQTFAQPSTDPRQRLVPAKETWVRALVLASQAGVPSPTVRVTGYRGAAILGTLAMSGPATLPVGSTTSVPDAVRYSEAQSFNAELPAAWVASGLSVRIEVDPEQRLGPATVLDATPRVGTATRLNIVLVPLVSGGFAPTMPTSAAVLDELERRFPLARSAITVTTRSAYTLSSVTNGLDTESEWSAALMELRQLRDQENPGNTYRYYYGFVRRAGGGVAGIGYVPGRAALGWDAANGWARTMSHELGHNFTRPHAPCGGVASPDPNYPYAGGLLGPTALVNATPATLDVVSPVNQTDIMGYCSGSWFSDYNYAAMQSHLEAQPQATTTATATQVAGAAAKGGPLPVLLVSGSIGADGVTFQPVQTLVGAASVAGGNHTLRIVTRDGRVVEQAFDAELVDHIEPPERHFAFTVVDPGPVARLEVVRNGAAVAPSAASRATAQRAGSASTIGQSLAVDWSEREGMLQVRWDAAAAPYLSVTHVGAERTVLAVNRRGGVLRVATGELPAGGAFEFGLSDGLNAQLVRGAR